MQKARRQCSIIIRGFLATSVVIYTLCFLIIQQQSFFFFRVSSLIDISKLRYYVRGNIVLDMPLLLCPYFLVDRLAVSTIPWVFQIECKKAAAASRKRTIILVWMELTWSRKISADIFQKLEATLLVDDPNPLQVNCTIANNRMRFISEIQC